MSDREISAIQFGKLMAAVEGLVGTMSNIQQDLSDQRGINSTLQQQLLQSQQTAQELKVLINGPDGSSGLLKRFQSLEGKLEATSAELAELKGTFADTRQLLIKLALLVGASASAGTAGVSKILSLMGL